MNITIVFTSTHFSLFENVIEFYNFYGFMGEEMFRVVFEKNGEKRTATYPKSIIHKFKITH